MRNIKIITLAGVALVVLSGPLQHIGAIPQTTVGSASKAVLKWAKDTLFPPAFAACGIGEGFGKLGSGGTGFSGTLSSGLGGGSAGNGGTVHSPSPSPGHGAAASGAAGTGAGGGAVPAGTPVMSGPVAGAGHGATVTFGGANGGFGVGAAAGGGGSAGLGIEVVVVPPGMGPAPFREPEILKPRALLVDGHQEARESNRVLLQLDGYAVMTAGNAKQGLESFDWFLPNVVLVDRDLPGNEVTEFARNVRKAKVGSTAVLLALSDRVEQERLDSLAAGFDGVLAKPLKLEDLRQVIELLARRSPRTQTARHDDERPARLLLSTVGRSSYAESAPAGDR